MQEIKSRTRRNLLKSGIGLATGTAVAGCIDEPETSSEPVDTDESETSDEQQSQGLQLNFTWNDILQAETQFYEGQATYHFGNADQTALEKADPTHIQNADLTNYNEFQNALVTTLNEIVHYLGNHTSSDSSVTTSEASAATNLILQEELENNQTYQEQGLDIKMMPLGNDGHGYTQVASTHHPLTTVDSNAPAVGQPHERPLERQRNVEVRDPISRFIDQDFHEVDELERSTYHGFPSDIYSKGSESSRHIGFDTTVIDDYYDNAIFSGDREGRELWMGPVREAVGTIRTLWDQDFFDEDYIAISSSPSDLPSVENHETFSLYAQDLVENHTDRYNETDEMREAVLEP